MAQSRLAGGAAKCLYTYFRLNAHDSMFTLVMPGKTSQARLLKAFFQSGALIAALIAIWNGFCYFPFDSWNAIRVAPALMLSAGLDPYPGPLEGPVTTWIYGPVPLLWMLPATLARTPVSIILCADVINVLLALTPVTLYAVFGPLLRSMTIRERILAGSIMLVCWPRHNLYYFQADNVAILCGMLSNLVLIGERSTRRLWGAAALAAFALWSKQNEIGVVLGQIAFLVPRSGVRDAAGYMVRVTTAAAALGCVFTTWTTVDGLYFNMFTLPSAFPTSAWYKLVEPAALPYIGFYVVVPSLLILTGCKRWLRTDEHWQLPLFVFIGSLPFGLLGFLKYGGTVNSLHAYAYLLPAVSLWIVQRFRIPRQSTFVACVAVSAMVAAGFALDLPRPWYPLTRGLRQGFSLAKQLPQAVYFPWNPVITWCAEGRFDNTEDGLSVRAKAGRPVTMNIVRSYLPPHMKVIAFHAAIKDEGVLRLAPSNATRSNFGEWSLVSWDDDKL